MKNVYLDHASATPVRKAVIDVMLPYFDRHFGNPSTVYNMGSKIKQVIDEQRAKVASLIGTKAEQIVFTSSGAEANNLAIKGVALAGQKKGNHIIVSAVEHHSVLNSARFFERMDFEVTFLPVDEYGLVEPQRLLGALRPETILVSIMHANNEIGTIEPISELSSICQEKGVLFHTDAVATVGNIPVDVNELNVDMLSLSGVSLSAPKGIGALYFRDNLRLMPLIHGGIQERGRRGGTESVPMIIGMGKAAELAAEFLEDENVRVRGLRDKLESELIEKAPSAELNGDRERRTPNTTNISFQYVEGEAILLLIDREGICASSGSACTAGSLEPSHVLRAMGLPFTAAHGTVRFSLSRYNTEEEVDYVIEKVPPIIQRLREISPFGREELAKI